MLNNYPFLTYTFIQQMIGPDDDKLKIDCEIEEMKKHSIDYSDIPERRNGTKVRLARKEFLDTLPSDIVREMARRRLKEMQAAGYELPEKVN